MLVRGFLTEIKRPPVVYPGPAGLRKPSASANPLAGAVLLRPLRFKAVTCNEADPGLFSNLWRDVAS